VKLAKYPKRDVVVTLQADFTESPEHIVPLVKTLEGGSDIVAGVLRTDDESYPRNMRWTRRAAGVLMGAALKSAPVSDPLCGFRAYRVIVLKKAMRAAGDAPLLSGEGWGANLQVLRVVAPHARRIEEVPLQLRLDLRARETRFRPMQTFRQLYRVRERGMWDGVEKRA
jgi:dolichol-phosphate mannosyltransferase